MSLVRGRQRALKPMTLNFTLLGKLTERYTVYRKKGGVRLDSVSNVYKRVTTLISFPTNFIEVTYL